MILITLKTGLSLLLAIAVQSFIVQQSQEGCAARPQKDSIEKILGKPVECPSQVKDGMCFRKNHSFILVYLESERVESLFISDHDGGIHGLTDLVDELVPKSDRGEILPHPPMRKPGTSIVLGSCKLTYREEYECLTMEYSEVICQNSAPASVNIVWR